MIEWILLAFVLSVFFLQIAIWRTIKHIADNQKIILSDMSLIYEDYDGASCKMCRQRLSYLNTENSDAPMFYYMCRLKNKEISLEYVCELFQDDRINSPWLFR
ncbi:MAG: hypothetical protein Kow00108_12400 [Calditrichia bacterium]